MKICKHKVTDPMPQDPNKLEENSVQNSDNATNGDQSKGEWKIYPEDLSDPKRCSKDADLLPAEMNGFIIIEPAGAGFADVIEIQIEAVSENDCLEPSEMCPSKIRTDTENDAQSYEDLSGIELEDSVSQESCKEIDGGSIKDICMDEGVPAKAKTLLEDIAEENHKCIFENSDPAKDTVVGSSDGKADVEWSVPVGLKSATDDNSSKVIIQHSESESEHEDVDIVSFEETYAEDSLSRNSIRLGSKDKSGTRHQESVPEFEVVADELACSSSTPESSNKETARVSRVEQMTHKPASNAMNTQIRDTSQVPEQQNPASAHVQRDCFESSFASVGPYTGSIAYSGSVSHRSDASTISTRSFAFPVLQNEWNFSPVRMRKADRRLLRRHRGWMHGLFCCKF